MASKSKSKNKYDSNALVIYNNDFSRLSLGKFGANELDFLMAICSKMRNKGTNKVRLSYEELKFLADYKGEDYARLEQTLLNVNEKLLSLNMRLKDNEEGTIIQFTLFNEFVTNSKERWLEISGHEKFSYILNEISQNFTVFELQEFTKLKSVYAKGVYRQLQRFKATGWWEISIEDFRYLLNIPENYKQAHIDARVLNPIYKELSPIFQNLKITKIYESEGRRGRPSVSAFLFEWDRVITDDITRMTEGSKKTDVYKESSESSGFICPECGKPLVYKKLNGNMAYCHDDFWKEGACKKIYNSVDEINQAYKKNNPEEPEELTPEQNENIAKLDGLLRDALNSNTECNITRADILRAVPEIRDLSVFLPEDYKNYIEGGDTRVYKTIDSIKAALKNHNYDPELLYSVLYPNMPLKELDVEII